MSQLMNNNNNNKKLLSSHSSNNIAPTRRISPTAGAGATSLHKYPTATSSSLLLSNVDVVSSSSSSSLSSASSLFSMTAKQSRQLTQNTSATSGSGFRTIPSFKIMSYQNIIALLAVLVCGLVTVNGLKCYMCGQYNEGVGSITPCLNYSEQYAHLYLKECSKKSEKYCVKYVSELSIVRDCATECAEKEIWETQTYCCTEDGCNGSAGLRGSVVLVMVPLVIYVVNEVLNVIKQQRR